MKPFHRFEEKHFMDVVASDLRSGDYIAHGRIRDRQGYNERYGAVQLKDVIVNLEMAWVCLEYFLPVGAPIVSNQDIEVWVDWKEKTPKIRVLHTIRPGDQVCRLKEEYIG
jgi:hypothetical protein